MEKRKKGLMISPKDWLVIERWQQEGIPLSIVLKGIEDTFKNADSSAVGGKSKIHRLSYCEAEIRSLWEKSFAHPGNAGKEFSLADRLDRIRIILQEAVTAHEGGTARAISRFAEEITRIREQVIREEEAGEKEVFAVSEEVKIRIRDGLISLAEQLRELIDRDKLEMFYKEVETKLRDYRRAMEPEEYRKTFRTLLHDRLLDLIGISETDFYF